MTVHPQASAFLAGLSEQGVPSPEQVPMTDQADTAAQEEVLVEDLLVEEVSIDGMCGVY
jgi:mycofactocin precursor